MCHSMPDTALTSPGMSPKPFVRPSSSELSASNCMPKQTPTTGLLLLAKSRIGLTKFILFNASIADGKAPTPGINSTVTTSKSSGLFTKRLL